MKAFQFSLILCSIFLMASCSSSEKPGNDEEIKEKFGDLLKEAENGGGFGWLASKESFVAYIILTDQFSRHIYRGSGDAFKNDVSTMIFTKLGFDLYRHQLVGYEFMFAFMPYMHTESLKYQKKGEKILIVDDVISTGGTLEPILQTLQNMGIILQDIIIAIEKGNGLERLKNERPEWPIRSLAKIEIIEGKVGIIE